MSNRHVALLIITALLWTSNAFAFGTINGFGQNSEHERITRHALGCGLSGGPAADVCFKAKAMQDLAGRSGTWGAVGAPDNPVNGKTSDAKSHCDDADFLPTSGYPHTLHAAELAIYDCRDYMTRSLNEAVTDAAPLIGANHKLVDSQIPTVFNCTFTGGKGRAFCNVLEDFGIVLHASQDFYSHSNWVDQPNGSKATGIDNPPGLNKRGRAAWLDLRVGAPAPVSGLMTGCFSGNLPDGVSGCPGRVTHYVLNKDKGAIDPAFGAGTTPRGAINDNFQHAVEAAIDDTRDKWALLQTKLVAKYGQRDGGLIICALVNGPDYAANCH